MRIDIEGIFPRKGCGIPLVDQMALGVIKVYLY